MTQDDKIRIALGNLLQALVDCHSYEVEYGAAGDGPIFQAYEALGIEPPQSLVDWVSQMESWGDSWD